MRLGVLCVMTIGVSGLVAPRQAQAQDGAAIYEKNCKSCHEAAGEHRAPDRATLATTFPEHINTVLESGVMYSQGRMLDPAQRRAVAEYITGKKWGSAPTNAIPQSAYCPTGQREGWNPRKGPSWNGWGNSPTNNLRFQHEEAAGLFPEQMPQLKLKWAFGLPGDYSAVSQPIVMGGRLFLGSLASKIYSLDAKTGCIQWVFQTDAGVRSAITIAPIRGGYAAYFGDMGGNAYAVNAATGRLLWKVKVDPHPDTTITGSVKVHEGRVYVPVASREEGHGQVAEYECCTFRGSVVALAADTGKQRWKTYMIPDEPKPLRKSKAGTQFWGPSGVGIWTSPTLDLKRKRIYVTTGNVYSPPDVKTSDAVVALDLDSGKMVWTQQFTEGDIWNAGCLPKADLELVNCDADGGPDWDFPASAILIDLPGNPKRQLLVGPQKQGLVALDPDNDGRVVWKEWGEKEPFGRLMYGPGADDKGTLYVATSRAGRAGGGGMYALDGTDGRRLWRTPHPGCGDKKPCNDGAQAAVTVTSGIAFSGGIDGTMRAYSTKDGKLLWEYDAVREFTAINGVPAKGGSFSGAGPTAVGGMLYATSGYTRVGGILPGNVLLAFSVDGK
jgi:polyvinyl alcohol dehydrogenase (cytochrome)